MIYRTAVKPGRGARDGVPKISAAMARAHTRAMTDVIEGAQEEMRDEIIAAALGFKLPKTIRARVYPMGRDSAEPAGIVYATPGKPGGRSAAAILRRYEFAEPITPALGEALAMPTKHVPMTGRNKSRPMSPSEVEATFNRRLQRAKLKSGNIGLFMRIGVGKRVLMFVLVRNVPGEKRTELGAIFEQETNKFGAIAAAHFESGGD